MLQPAIPQGSISIPELARRLQASESTVRHWVATGILPCARRLDSQGRVTECLILETDFLAFAQRSGMSAFMTLGGMETPIRAAPAREMTSILAGGLHEALVGSQARPAFMPASWRWAETTLRLVWLVSGLAILAAAVLLAWGSWWR